MARKGSKAWLRNEGRRAGFEAAKEGREPVRMLNKSWDDAAAEGFAAAKEAGIGCFTTESRGICRDGRRLLNVTIAREDGGAFAIWPDKADELIRRIVELLNEHGVA